MRKLEPVISIMRRMKQIYPCLPKGGALVRRFFMNGGLVGILCCRDLELFLITMLLLNYSGAAPSDTRNLMDIGQLDFLENIPPTNLNQTYSSQTGRKTKKPTD